MVLPSLMGLGSLLDSLKMQSSASPTLQVEYFTKNIWVMFMNIIKWSTFLFSIFTVIYVVWLNRLPMKMVYPAGTLNI